MEVRYTVRKADLGEEYAIWDRREKHIVDVGTEVYCILEMTKLNQAHQANERDKERGWSNHA